jgi:CheY-like chemotaxis protein
LRLLIVDDEPVVAGFFGQVASLDGDCEIEMAASGEEALGLVVQNVYDLITLDIQMPGASGLEILSMLRTICPHAVIAIISGHVGEAELPDIAGCADVIMQKPVSLERFTTLLHSVRHIVSHMQTIRDLGDIPVPSYRSGTICE